MSSEIFFSFPEPYTGFEGTKEGEGLLCPCTIPVTLGMWFSSRTTLGEQRIRDEFNFLLPKLTSSAAARNAHDDKPVEWDAGGTTGLFPEQVLGSRADTPQARNWPFMSSPDVSISIKRCFLLKPVPGYANKQPTGGASVLALLACPLLGSLLWRGKSKGFWNQTFMDF